MHLVVRNKHNRKNRVPIALLWGYYAVKQTIFTTEQG